MPLPTTTTPFPSTSAFPGQYVIWGTGDNTYGQLALSATIFSSLSAYDYYTLSEAPGIPFTASKLAAGLNHILALQGYGGVVYSAGDNTLGQLGRNTTTFEQQRFFFGVLNNATDIFAGYNSSFAITSGGNLWAWGDSSYGQLGDGYNNVTYPGNFYTTPIQIPGQWIKVATGQYHSLALSAGPPDDDTLVVAGAYNYPDLSINGTYRRFAYFFDSSIWAKVAPTTSLGAHFIAFDENAWVLMDGNSTGWFTSSAANPPLSSAADVLTWTASNSAWNVPTITRRQVGLLYGSGDNTNGELGVSSLSSSVVLFTPLMPGNFSDIVTGNNCSFAISGNDVYVAGVNQYGQLGIGVQSVILDWAFLPAVIGKISSNKNSSKVQTLAIFKTLSACGYNVFDQISLPNNSYFTFTDLQSAFDHAIAGDGFSIAVSGISVFGTGQYATSAYGITPAYNQPSALSATLVYILSSYTAFTIVSGFSAIPGQEPDGAGVDWSMLLGLSSYAPATPHPTTSLPGTTTTTTPAPPIAGLSANSTVYSSAFLYSSAFNAKEDFTVSFACLGNLVSAPTYALSSTYGWSVFFVNGTTATLSGGGPGQDLGLISTLGGQPIQGLFLAIGFDRIGKFALSAYPFTTGITLTAANSITVRQGTINTSTQFNYISSVVPTMTGIFAFDEVWRTIKVNVRRYFQEIDILQQVGDTYTTIATIQTGLPLISVPNTLKFGMSYSGNASFLIKDLTVNYSV